MKHIFDNYERFAIRWIVLGTLVLFAYAVSGQDKIELKQDTKAGVYTLTKEGTVPPPDSIPCQVCPKGDPGEPGKTPQISVGPTVTLPAGSQANVTQTGTAESPIFNFFIPGSGSSSGGSLPHGTFVVNATGGTDNNNDSPAIQAAINAAIAMRGGHVIIPVASNKWFLEQTINVLPASGSQAFVDVTAYGAPGNISWRGGSNRPVFHIMGLHSSDWEGLNIEVPNAYTNVPIFNVDCNSSIGSSSFNHFQNMYLNANNVGVVGFRMGFTTASHGDISNWTINNVAFFGTRQAGQFLVQSLHGNVLANNLTNVFVAFSDGVYSNFAIPGADRGGCWGSFVGIHTSQNICEFYFAREGNYPVINARLEGSGKLLTTGSGTYNISATFIGLRMNDMHGAGVLMEINTPGTYTLRDCHMHRQDGQTFTDLITLNGQGGFGTVKIDGGMTRANNLVRKVGGSTQWKVYIEGLQRINPPDAVRTDGWYPDVQGQQF